MALSILPFPNFSQRSLKNLALYPSYNWNRTRPNGTKKTVSLTENRMLRNDIILIFR